MTKRATPMRPAEKAPSKSASKPAPAAKAPTRSAAPAAPHDPLAERLLKLYSGAVHDVMRAMGLSDFTLPAGIHSLTVDTKIAGPVFTLRGRVDPKADAHATLLAWTGFLSAAKPGHIVVIQPNDKQVAHMGELSGETLMRKGVPGVVIDGGTRDVSFLIDMKLPVYARYTTPRDIVGYWMVDATEVQLRIGPTTVNSGDYILADRDGIVVLPRGRTEEIVAAAEAATTTENKIRTAILDGMDPQEAYLKYGKF